MRTPHDHRLEELDTLRSDLRVIEDNLALPADRLGSVVMGKLQRERRRLKEQIAALEEE